MKTIERFYEEDPIDVDLFFNGKYDFWHQMPKMVKKTNLKSYVFNIKFNSNEEIIEFYKLIKFKEKWGGTKDIIPLNATTFRVRMPNDLVDKKRNTNYRFVHKDTALANPNLYEIISLENLHYEEKR